MNARGRRFTGADSSWWHMEEPTNQMAITAVMVLDAPLDEVRLRRLLRRRLVSIDRFHERVIEPVSFGRPQWVDSRAVRLDEHLVTARLPEPATRPQLEALVSREMSTPLDPSRPLWRVVYVPDYLGGSALVARIHHCIADGMALIHLLLELDDEEDGCGAYWAAGGRRHSAAGTLGGRALEWAGRGARAAASLGRIAGMKADDCSSLRCELGGEKRAAWSQPLPLAALRGAAHGAGATLNDLLVSTVAGGIGTYLTECGRVAGERLRAVIPVNLRSEQERAPLGNRFGLVFAPLPVMIEDPVERIHVVRSTMERLKRSPEAGVVFGLLELFGRAPRRALGAAVSFLGSKASLVFTNVPGPRRRIRFCGAEVTELVAWVPASGRLGLGVSALTYGDELRFGIAADRRLLPDPRRLVETCERAAEQLLGRPAVMEALR